MIYGTSSYSTNSFSIFTVETDVIIVPAILITAAALSPGLSTAAIITPGVYIVNVDTLLPDVLALKSTPIKGLGTFEQRGAVDNETYHILVTQGEKWELRRAVYEDTFPPRLVLGTLLDSSNGGSAETFNIAEALEVVCVIPGIKSELQALYTA